MTSIFGTNPYSLSFAAIPLVALLAYVPHIAKNVYLAKILRYDNTAPRDYIAQAESRAKPSQKETLAKAKRALAAHANGLEAIPIISAALLAAIVAGVPPRTVDTVAVVIVSSRFLYNFLYIYGTTEAVAAARSLAWGAGTLSSLYLGVRAALTKF